MISLICKNIATSITLCNHPQNMAASMKQGNHIQTNKLIQQVGATSKTTTPHWRTQGGMQENNAPWNKHRSLSNKSPPDRRDHRRITKITPSSNKSMSHDRKQRGDFKMERLTSKVTAAIASHDNIGSTCERHIQNNNTAFAKTTLHARN